MNKDSRLALVIEPRKEHYRRIGKVLMTEDANSDLCSYFVLMNFDEPYNYWFMNQEVKFLTPEQMPFDVLVDEYGV